MVLEVSEEPLANLSCRVGLPVKRAERPMLLKLRKSLNILLESFFLYVFFVVVVVVRIHGKLRSIKLLPSRNIKKQLKTEFRNF